MPAGPVCHIYTKNEGLPLPSFPASFKVLVDSYFLENSLRYYLKKENSLRWLYTLFFLTCILIKDHINTQIKKTRNKNKGSTTIYWIHCKINRWHCITLFCTLLHVNPNETCQNIKKNTKSSHMNKKHHVINSPDFNLPWQ